MCTSLLGICIIDSLLLYTGAQGSRTHMEQGKFYEVLATQLGGNEYDKTKPSEETKYCGDSQRC